jgi:hypothetical protein
VSEAVVELPPSLRGELKEPMGPVYTDADELLAAADSPIITVGDMVTYHLLEAGRVPDVALVDDRTERTAVEADVRDAITGFDREEAVANPPATLTAALLDALQGALERADTESTLVVVDGEEDLAALPAIAAVPDGASVLYGQPDEGVVHVVAGDAVRERVTDLLARMDGETTRAWDALGIDQ